jgi:hypothetical protein
MLEAHRRHHHDNGNKASIPSARSWLLPHSRRLFQPCQLIKLLAAEPLSFTPTMYPCHILSCTILTNPNQSHSPPVHLPALTCAAAAQAASLGELAQALHVGFDPHHIVFDSPAKTVQELR